MNKKQMKYLVALVDAVKSSDAGLSWAEVKVLFEDLGFNADKYKNGWIYVRQIVATARVNGLIERTDDIHHEQYIDGPNALSDFGIDPAEYSQGAA